MTPGLLVFVIVVAVDVVGLLLDYCLYAAGWTTVTEWSRVYPMIRVVVIAWHLAGAIGLVEHFYFAPKGV